MIKKNCSIIPYPIAIFLNGRVDVTGLQVNLNAIYGNNMDTNELKQVIQDALTEHHAINFSEHSAHHEWIQERIETEKARKEMFNEVTKAAIQWSITGLLGYAAYWIQGHFK